ncbi:GntR family transcriptional regulator [Lachnospiraceae bacterium 62-35]
MPIPSIPKNTSPKTARERVYIQLKEWIIYGVLRPEEKISDQEIAQYFSISRTPVREAIQLLADQKLIEVSPGKESRIAPIDSKNVRQVYIIISELDALAVRFAAPSIGKNELDELNEVNQNFSLALNENDQSKARQLDNKFHGIFFRIAANDFLTNFNEVLRIHIERIENLHFTGQNSNSTDSFMQHQTIIDALKKGDTERAMEMIRLNWIHTIDTLLN